MYYCQIHIYIYECAKVFKIFYIQKNSIIFLNDTINKMKPSGCNS